LDVFPLCRRLFCQSLPGCLFFPGKERLGFLSRFFLFLPDLFFEAGAGIFFFNELLEIIAFGLTLTHKGGLLFYNRMSRKGKQKGRPC